MDYAREDIRISVIVPFFNAERYIADCVRSLMRQTISRRIEFIFINDCSTDRSLSILRAAVSEFPHRIPQVAILENTVNRGPAFSRQRGMDAARGEFLIHCDADDWVEPEMYAKMLRTADATGADVVCVPFFIEKGGGKTQVKSFPSLDFPHLNDMPLDTLHCSLWNKIIRRRVLTDNHLRIFEGVDCWEDVSVFFRVAMFTRRIVIYNKPLYHYRKETSDSLTTARMDRVLADHLHFCEEMNRWFASQPPEQEERYRQFILFAEFTAKIKMLRGPNKDVLRWKRTYPEANRHIMSYKNVPFFYRLCFYASDRLPLRLVRAIIAISRIF